MKKDVRISIKPLIHSVACLIVISLCVGACTNAKKDAKEHYSANMQRYVDSCSTLYLNAINEIKGGADKDSTKLKYAAKIIFLHSEFSKTFDSITLAYTNKKITQIEYDNIRESIVLDSVGKRSEELSGLGVNIELMR